MRRDRLQIAAGVALPVIIVGGAWLFAVSPALSHAGSLRHERADAEQQNTALQGQIRRLAAARAHRDTLEAQLRAAATALPSDSGLTAFTRQLSASASTRGVTISSITAATPEVAGKGSSGSSGASGASGNSGAPAPSAPSGASSPAGVYDIPVSVMVSGPVDRELAFLADLQSTRARAALVSSVTFGGDGAASSPTTTMTVALKVFTVPKQAGTSGR